MRTGAQEGAASWGTSAREEGTRDSRRIEVMGDTFLP